jgi:hypothetical protein
MATAMTTAGANTGRAFGHRHRIPNKRASGSVWRWRQDPSFAYEVDLRQGQRRQSIHDELDAGVIESVRMLRGPMADTDAPPGARVRAATALMDRAGLTPCLCG